MSKRVALFGASGTIGRAVALALTEAGHTAVCILRVGSLPSAELEQCEVRYGKLEDAFENENFDAVISCIASRSGEPTDAWAVDYQTNSNILRAAEANTVKQFILLSAICVQKPKLAFQHAKLAFENELRKSEVTYSIVRPTAFFKSLSGQIERVKAGKPYLLFGDGQLTCCKPISDTDLADFIVNCLEDPAKQNRILPIGGPGPAVTPLEQGQELFRLIGTTPRFRRMPVGVMSAAICLLSLAGRVSKTAAAKAEYARIGRYYATESMLVWDDAAQRYDEAATPEFGRDTLFDHYKQRLKSN